MFWRQLRANDNGHCGNLPYNVVDIYSIGESQSEKARNGAGNWQIEQRGCSMPKQLVFWRTDKNDDYVHTNQHCPEIVNAKTVQCGTIEQAQHTGHVRACPKCYEKSTACERLQPTEKSQPPKPAETKDSANKCLGAAVAVLALLCCFVWWVNDTPHTSRQSTTTVAAVSEYSTETRTTATPRPTARPTATPKPTAAPASKDSYTVYITRTGSKYHRDGCQYLRSSKIEIDKKEAIENGYTACSKCKP